MEGRVRRQTQGCFCPHFPVDRAGWDYGNEGAHIVYERLLCGVAASKSLSRGHCLRGRKLGWRAVELLPVEKDQVGGNVMIKYLAMIAAWIGDKDLACEQLTIALRRPSDLSYGQLKLMPTWDALRGDPRFERIVEEAKQPVALK